MDGLLGQGTPVIVNAANMLAHHRDYFYRAAQRAEARLILVSVEAPAEVVRQRIPAREETPVPRHDSETGCQVYKKMKPRGEKISRNHFVVDTSPDITAVIDNIVRATTK
jgi:predicted kinase